MYVLKIVHFNVILEIVEKKPIFFLKSTVLQGSRCEIPDCKFLNMYIIQLL